MLLGSGMKPEWICLQNGLETYGGKFVNRIGPPWNTSHGEKTWTAQV